MRDIFGKQPGSYAHYRALPEGDSIDAFNQRRLSNYAREFGHRDWMDKAHDFDSLKVRAIEGPDALGFVSDNLTAFDAQVQETLYGIPNYREWVAVTQAPDPGVKAVGVETIDWRARAQVISDIGTTLPTVSVGTRTQTAPLVTHAIAAQYSREEAANAAYRGIALETRQVEAAVQAVVYAMNDDALYGSDELPGMINATTRAANSTTNLDRPIRYATSTDFTTAGAAEIAKVITDHISRIIINTDAAIFRLGGTIVVMLPLAAYNVLTSSTLNDKGSDITIREHVLAHNPWTADDGSRTVEIMPLSELSTAGTTDGDSDNTGRMVITLRHPDAIRFVEAISPRVLDAQLFDLGIRVPVYAKHTPGLMVLHPLTRIYVDGVGI